MFKIIVALVLSISASVAIACSWDTDCNVGSKCVKGAYQMYGSCMGGMNPGNSNDRQPVRYQMDIGGKKGNTCSFDTECGVGDKCMKSSGQIYGTCM